MRTLLLLSVLLAACGPAKKTESNKSKDLNTDVETIAFLVLRIRKDTVQGKNTIELVSLTKTAGKIKSDPQNHIDSENYLTLELYEQGKLINTMLIAHPLYKRVEYADGNTLKSKSIELDKEEFFIRMQVKGDSGKIRVFETLKGTSKKELMTIKLQK